MILDDVLRAGLEWFPGYGIGHLRVVADPTRVYDAAYFEKYQRYADTEMGRAITRLRIDLVDRFTTRDVLDVGIGCGAFVQARRHMTFGYDVSDVARRWLCDRGLWWDPYAKSIDSVTMWDVLEHIEDPGPLLANVRRFVFCSLPIFSGPEHVLQSKHFRPDEHCWYFTSWGLQRFMAYHGFRLLWAGMPETGVGREDIGSFVFERAVATSD